MTYPSSRLRSLLTATSKTQLTSTKKSRLPTRHGISCAIGSLLLASVSMLTHAADNYDLEVVVDKAAPIASHDVIYVPFAGNRALSDTILSDLSSTSLRITTNNLLHQPHSINELTESMPAWQSLGVPYMVVGSSQLNGGMEEVQFQVINLTTSPAIVEGNRVRGTNKTVVAHKAANRIYEIITGNAGDFDASIIYIEEVWGQKGKISSLKIMDANGGNVRDLTAPINGSIFSPAVSPDGNHIAYAVQLENRHATLWIHDLRTNTVKQLLNLKGDNLSPSFSPDGSKVLFQSTFDGDADIYLFDRNAGNIQKVLDLPYEQTHPSFASNGDGQSFVFASDHEQPNVPSIYRASFSGNITRLTRGGYASAPSYSADGTKIGYLSGSNAVVMSNSGSRLANFGNTAIDEAPSFSPSGERVVYSQGQGNSTIIIRPLNGGRTITKRATGVVRSPVWVSNNR